MTLQSILDHYRATFLTQYCACLNPDQWAALHAIEGYRQGSYGDLQLHSMKFIPLLVPAVIAPVINANRRARKPG